MKSIEVIGNVGGVPQRKETANGKKFFTFGLAESRKSETTWFNVIIDGEPAFIPYITKGRPLFVRGDFKAEIYNNTIYYTLYAERVEFIGKREEDVHCGEGSTQVCE